MREKKVLLWIMILFISVRLISLTREEVIEETQYLETTKDINIEKIMFFEGDYYDDWYEYTHNNLQSANVGDYSYPQLFYNNRGGYRRFYEFPFIPPPQGWEILSVNLKIYQRSCCGDGENNHFPEFFLFSDQVLKVALAQQDFQQLATTFYPLEFQEIGVISDDSSNTWKHLDVTDVYLSARDIFGYESFSIMLYFEIFCDYDQYDDAITIDTASSSNRPKLLFQYVKATSNSESECESITPLIHCYPNPTSEMLTIKNESKKAISAINIYNLKGQKVFSKQNLSTKNGEVNLALPTNIASGIYFVQCKIDGNQQTITKKIFVK